MYTLCRKAESIKALLALSNLPEYNINAYQENSNILFSPPDTVKFFNNYTILTVLYKSTLHRLQLRMHIVTIVSNALEKNKIAPVRIEPKTLCVTVRDHIY